MHRWHAVWLRTRSTSRRTPYQRYGPGLGSCGAAPRRTVGTPCDGTPWYGAAKFDVVIPYRIEVVTLYSVEVVLPSTSLHAPCQPRPLRGRRATPWCGCTEAEVNLYPDTPSNSATPHRWHGVRRGASPQETSSGPHRWHGIRRLVCAATRSTSSRRSRVLLANRSTSRRTPCQRWGSLTRPLRGRTVGTVFDVTWTESRGTRRANGAP